jgi:hypothetical protein
MFRKSRTACHNSPAAYLPGNSPLNPDPESIWIRWRKKNLRLNGESNPNCPVAQLQPNDTD